MKLEKPFIIEVNSNTYRGNGYSNFGEFQLAQNLVAQNKATKMDMGVIIN